MITGPGIAQLYLDHIYRWFGLPIKVISNQDPCFTSHFRKGLAKKLGIQQNLSTAFHPQTNGLLEQKNQWVEQYLWLVTSAAPKDWTQWLALASAVHNNQRNSTTSLSPNQVLLGYNISLNLDLVSSVINETVEECVKLMEQRWAQATVALNEIAE